eukprot:2671515-Rhodomonas_salina.1
METRTQPDMLRWKERDEDWVRDLPTCPKSRSVREIGREVITNMVSEAERIGGRLCLNTARRRHESKEQRMLWKDIVTIQKCEEEWWVTGALGVTNKNRLDKVSDWPGLASPKKTDRVAYEKGGKLLARAREDREKTDKKVTQEQKADNAKQ